MFSILPKDFGFAFTQIPVWQWESADAPDTAACDRLPAVTPDAAPGPAAGEDTASAPDRQLVFKGYVWAPVAHWVPVLDPVWDHYVLPEGEDLRAQDENRERERHQVLQGTLQRSQRAAQGPDGGSDDPAHGRTRVDRAPGKPPRTD